MIVKIEDAWGSFRKSTQLPPRWEDRNTLLGKIMSLLRFEVCVCFETMIKRNQRGENDLIKGNSICKDSKVRVKVPTFQEAVS